MSKSRALSLANRQWLVGELDVWQEAGLVDKTEAARILGLYERAAEEANRTHLGKGSFCRAKSTMVA